MKFLIGLFIGIIISIGVVSSPEPRRQMLDAVLSWVEKVKALPVKSSESVQPSDIQRLVRQKVFDVKTELVKTELVKTEFFPPELVLEEPLLEEPLLEAPSSPGLPSSKLPSSELSLPEQASSEDSQPGISPPGSSLTELTLPELPLHERSSQERSSQELSSQERSSLSRGPSEFSQPEISRESQMPGSKLFQVAWLPFRSETSAKGFASKLKKQLAHDFQVIKTGPGRYEVGFHFDSQRDRKIILNAINDLTGFESTQPPRIVQL